MAKGKLDDFKIKKAPAAFAGFARQFNAQVDLLASMIGGPGLDVQFAIPQKGPTKGKSGVTPKPVNRGKIVLSVKGTALQAIGVGGSSSTNSVNVVTSDGTLATLSVPGSNATIDYPTRLQTALSGNYRVVMEPTEVGPSRNDLTEYAVLTSAGLEMKSASSGKVCRILHSDVTQNISIQTFVGCNSGNPANYLVIASDFF